MPRDEQLPTRASLLNRLKDAGDNASWDEFHRTYRDLIFSVARRAGLNEQEADEVVQDTLISVAKKMPEFTYDPAKDSFKGWLLTVTRWRIKDQIEKRARTLKQEQTCSSRLDELTTRTATVDRLPDPAGSDLAAAWDQEWEAHLLHLALTRLKRKVHPQHYQIYHLHVILGQSAREVARVLNVSIAQIYLAKHRLSNLVKNELRTLRKTLF